MSFNALVLAGSRAPGPDAVATYAGAPHKALIELDGRTLLARVVEAVAAAGAARIGVSASDPAVLAAVEALPAETLPAEGGPSLSVEAGAKALGFPLLVTTADHALLRPEWIGRFLADVPAEADVAALVTRRAAVEAAAPGAQRTWLKLADGDWKGCNLFYLATPRALSAVAFWRRIEADRKRPWRQAALIGPGMLLSYLAGRLSLAGAAEALGRRADVQAAIVETAFGLAAIDVDKPADLDLVRTLTAKP